MAPNYSCQPNPTCSTFTSIPGLTRASSDLINPQGVSATVFTTITVKPSRVSSKSILSFDIEQEPSAAITWVVQLCGRFSRIQDKRYRAFESESEGLASSEQHEYPESNSICCGHLAALIGVLAHRGRGRKRAASMRCRCRLCAGHRRPFGGDSSSHRNRAQASGRRTRSLSSGFCARNGR